VIIISKDCVDIISTSADPTRNFFRVRFRNPKLFVGGKYSTPQWGQKAAMTIGTKYYGVKGCKITMAQPVGGRWMIQNVLIPKNGGVEMTEELALQIANHIQDRIEREGQWTAVMCRDNETKRYISKINGRHIERDERGRFAPHAAEEFGAETFDETYRMKGATKSLISDVLRKHGYDDFNELESENLKFLLYDVYITGMEVGMESASYNAEEFGAENESYVCLENGKTYRLKKRMASRRRMGWLNESPPLPAGKGCFNCGSKKCIGLEELPYKTFFWPKTKHTGLYGAEELGAEQTQYDVKKGKYGIDYESANYISLHDTFAEAEAVAKRERKNLNDDEVIFIVEESFDDETFALDTNLLLSMGNSQIKETSTDSNFDAEEFEAQQFYNSCSTNQFEIFGRNLFYKCSNLGSVRDSTISSFSDGGLGTYNGGKYALRLTGGMKKYEIMNTLAEVSQDMQPNSMEDWKEVISATNQIISATKAQRRMKS
jgi:hypothetical protein